LCLGKTGLLVSDLRLREPSPAATARPNWPKTCTRPEQSKPLGDVPPRGKEPEEFRRFRAIADRWMSSRLRSMGPLGGRTTKRRERHELGIHADE